MGLCLSPAELEELTGARWRRLQARALRGMGIEHRVRHDGSIVVLREHVADLLNPGTAASLKRSPAGPDWSAL